MSARHRLSTVPPHDATAVTDDPACLEDEAVRAPGLAAAIRRHPAWTRRGAVGAIATGTILFVIASLTAPFAGADTHHTQTTPSSHRPTALPDLVSIAVTAKPKVLTAKPVTAARKAPATVAVISGLAANGIPTVALNAYRVAAARMAHASPSCGIDWALLAGIGREESDHGRFAGAVLHSDGTSSPHIVGPALDGKSWDLIRAPANGMALDGDAVYAHALGPMQFIPGTWAGYGADANGDGVADIFNINDAALGSARYLCAAGGNLRTTAGQSRAVLAYNHSDAYLAQVLALANAYRKGIAVTGIPVGDITGALPPVRSGNAPPANPADPTAAGRTRSTKTSSTSKTKKHSTAGSTASGSTARSAGGSRSGGSGTTASPVPRSSTPSPVASTPAAPPALPTSTPSPPPTCQVLLGGTCVVP